MTHNQLMPCEVECTDEFKAWWDELDEGQQDAVATGVRKLQTFGVTLGDPHSSQVHGSKHGAMRELRILTGGRKLRVLYIFDPRRQAALLIGGDKTGIGDRWYAAFVPKADAIYDQYLVELRKEGLI